MSIVTYGATKVIQSGAKLKRDEEGFYKVILGTFNVFNSVGEYYQATEAVKRIFDKSGSFLRRMRGNYLTIEQGHPEYPPGMTNAEKAVRFEKLNEKSTCGVVKEVFLQSTNKRTTGAGENVIQIIGWVKPAGPYAESLRGFLDDPTTNGAFSIRCKYDLYKTRTGLKIRAITRIINWDFVTEPGLSGINISEATGLESFDYVTIDTTDKILVRDITRKLQAVVETGTESSSYNAMVAIKEFECTDKQCMYNW